MFVICGNCHLGVFYESEVPLFIEKDSGIFFNRKSCLKYFVENGFTKEDAVEHITLMQKKSGTWFSF